MAENRRTCASCGTTNEEDARFCEACGGSLARVCATCGLEARASARFCRGCGAPLEGQVTEQEAPAAGPVRKTVTVMFADLAGSTSFEETVDVETARDVIGRYHDLLRSIAQRHRAGMTKYIGDGFMAVWGVPEIGPDDATHAVDAAAELQERFVELAARVAETHGVELALRVAVNTGEVVVGEGDADLVGDALNVGARLEAECPLGRVVVGEETWRATRGRYGYESLGQVQVRGRTAPVAVYQWRGRRTETPDATPLVGRADEIRRLQSVFDDAVAARAARLVTVIGDPGVGKSRLASEFTAAQGEVRVLEARCLLEGTVALAPMVEVLRALKLETDIPATVPERDRLLRDLNGLVSGDAGSVEENFWALRRFVEVLGANRPVLLILDDIQWADTLLLDFIEHLVEWVHEIPVFALALARPELRESRPDLVTVSRWVSEAVHLGGLDARATAELAAKVLGAARLPDDLLRRLPASTGGNPLFVRELIGMLAHDGVLVEQPTGWRLTIDVDAIAIPPTIHALLASRLERLERSDRRVLEIASVVGSDFSLGVVRALAGSAASGVESSLNRLRRRELVQPSGAYAGDEPVWRFHHVLIRDVAYRRLLKSDRADLHEQLADWVETGGPSVAFNADEMIARHLEAAHTYRLELGTVDEHTSGLALRSARRYAASARRALDRDELVSAGNQAARGAALATADEALHADLLLTGCEAFLSAGDVAAGAPLVEDLERIADEALSPWAVCYRCQFTVYTEPARLPEVDALLQGAIDEFSRRRDHAGLAKAHRVRAGARARLGRIGDCEADLFEALIAARQSGDHRQITAALGAAPGAALWGPSPVPKAGGRCLDVVRMQRMTTAAPSLEATSLRHLAVLELLRGRPDKARAMLADAHQVVSDLGLRHGLMETELFAGIIESMEGDPAAAEPHFRTALDGLQALGLGADAGQAAALLAKSVLAQGGVDEADAYAAESERLAGRNLKSAIAWRAVRAEILAAHGRHQDAVAMAREAVEVAAGTDLVLDHADACLTLSRILAKAGDEKGADTARDNATALYAAKEVTSGITRMAEPITSPVLPPAPAAKPARLSRLEASNRATLSFTAVIDAMEAGNVDAAAALFSDRVNYDDRRRLSGNPIEKRAGMRMALEHLREQYGHFESRVLAVRGEYLALSHVRWFDDAGNETTGLIVSEVDDDGQIVYQGRFDEDFDCAYRELDRRYCAGEGAPFAEGGAAGTEWTLALNRNDFDAMFDEFMTSDFCIKNRSRSSFPDRSAAEYRTTLEELAAMVVSSRSWSSAMRWLSPTCFVARCEREAVGADGEHYNWIFVIVFEFRDGRIASMCEFEPDDEDAAFAYAEERVRATTSRLAVTNRASALADAAWRALQLRDAEAAVGAQQARFVYDDRRRLSGGPIAGPVELRAATHRILEQYPHTEWRTLAVRGERLEIRWQHLWDDAGNEATTLNVLGFDEDGQLEYFGRFDEDDFEGAYRELEHRYYAGEGAAFAEAGAVVTEWITALNNGDFDRAFYDLTDSEMRIENRSQSVFGNRAVSDWRASFEELYTMVDSVLSWPSAVCWLSPTLGVARIERKAVGFDGEDFGWTWLGVSEFRGGRLTSLCNFELEDEAAAFAYAAERMRATASRLAVTNRSCEFLPAFVAACRAHDIDGVLRHFSDRFVYDDRRGISGDPVVDLGEMRTAIERVFDQYTRFDAHVLAVRGQRLHLQKAWWADDDGNETTTFYVMETGDDGRIVYHARFDENDFESAYREIERRYYAGEGTAFADGGATSTATFVALNHGDYDRVFGGLVDRKVHIENRSRSAFGDRSASDLRSSWGELDTMISSLRIWPSAVCWLSPQWSVSRIERQAVGHDGELYAWTFVLVAQIEDGRTTSLCQFELEDEDAAFAYAEERMCAAPHRLAVVNRASETADAAYSALRARDVEGMVANFSDRCLYEDRRRLSGNPIDGIAGLRANIQRLVGQYSRFEWHTLAVRGERLVLVSSHISTDEGFETSHLFVCESGVDGLITYQCTFDGEDFEAAYRELERRYLAGEGAAFAETGTFATEFVTALARGDPEEVSTALSAPGLRVENRSRSAFGDRSAAEFRASFVELNAMVASVRTYQSAVCWLSPTLFVGRFEREAVGHDGEQYTWTHLHVVEIQGGRITCACLFDHDDEDAAFAYAEERLRATTSKLQVSNLSSDVAYALTAALRAGDADDAMRRCSDRMIYEDHRRLSADPIRSPAGFRAVFERIMQQYSDFERSTLAVRGDKLNLNRTRWSDGSGNESCYLHVHEVDGDGRIVYEGRFDEDDFEGAYRTLSERFYAGEGAAFAEGGTAGTEYMMTYNKGDFDRLVGELTHPETRFENRSHSVIPDRSAAELRETAEELSSMVSSSRTWNSVEVWLSPNWCIHRFEREAAGLDDEQYKWTWIYVTEFHDGQMVSSIKFDLEDEEAAFAYAEERVLAAASRLALRNRASRTADALMKAMNAASVTAALDCFSDQFVYHDRRRLSGEPIRDKDELPLTATRILQQYNLFDTHILAVRGERLSLDRGRWSNDAGFETIQLSVNEVDDAGQIIYQIRFDENDFEGAYRELDKRYYAGEGAAFSEQGPVLTEWQIALNQRDFDRLFGELTAPDLRVENRSSSVFGDRSAVELRVSVEELDGMVASARSWHSNLYWLSPHWVVARMEREAVGLDDERYAWSWLDVYKFDGRLSSACRFELGDEEAAFAFAEEQVRASASRLAVANRASGTASTITAALCAGDPDRASSCFSKDFVYDDRRQLSGDPIWGGAQLRLACERILAQYNRFVDRVLAVRGEHLVLGWSRWSNDSGYATTQLAVNEIGDDGKVLYQVRFDEDDFAGAYHELTRRYCVGQDGEFADAVSFTTEWLMALNDRDFDRVFGELTAPGLRLENRSSSVFPDRSVADLRATYEELNGMMASMRSWTSAEYWPSPDCVVNRHERQAVGRDGEKYSWSRIYVTEIHNGRMSSLCQFDVDDEDSAIAYAEERVRADASPLAVTNRAKQTWDALNHLANAQDFDGLAACFSPSLVNDDRRRWSGHALNDMRTAAERVAEQYTHLDMRSLAVRGDRLHLGRTRYVNDSGFESTAFWVIEVDDDGRIVYLSRFDDDAFEDAYRDFEQRYYTGEGAAFADLGALSTEWVAAVNRGDLDRAFTEFTSPDASFENRSHTAFPDPTVSDPGDSFRALQALVASSRTWASAVRHLSPHWSIVRLEREAVGPDDEQYAWTWLHVAEIRNGRCTSSFLFDPDDEDTAFAYAEERVRRTASLEP